MIFILDINRNSHFSLILLISLFESFNNEIGIFTEEKRPCDESFKKSRLSHPRNSAAAGFSVFIMSQHLMSDTWCIGCHGDALLFYPETRYSFRFFVYLYKLEFARSIALVG